MTVDDDFWMREPTALEAARYDEARRVATDLDDRRRRADAERARMIFGECLLALVSLGVKEQQARSMLGKWRGQTKDDALLSRIVKQAAGIGSPDPIAYVTRAIAAQKERTDGVAALADRRWTFVGWEAPRRTRSGVRWFGPTRGKVWRDPHGSLHVLPAEEGAVVPGLEDEPGVEWKGAA